MSGKKPSDSKNEVTLNEANRVILYGKLVTGVEIGKDALGRKQRADLDGEEPHLACIYGYKIGARKSELPQPMLLVVGGVGSQAAGWEEVFPGGEYTMWPADLDDAVTRIDVFNGELGDLLNEHAFDTSPIDAQTGEPLLAGSLGATPRLLRHAQSMRTASLTSFGGRSSDGWTSDGRTSDGSSSDGRSSEGRSSEGRSSEGRSS